jgi:LPXTG-motif cell wall-anchored protein
VSRWLPRLALPAAIAAGALFTLAPTATFAGPVTVPLHQTDGSDFAAILAANFDPHNQCDFGGGPYLDKDVWIFVEPGEHKDTDGDFTSVTLVFNDGTNDHTEVINNTSPPPTDRQLVNGPGAAKAWIQTPAGWTLKSGSAIIDDNGKTFFNLSHTCAAGDYTPPTTTTPPVTTTTSTTTTTTTTTGTTPGTPGTTTTDPGGHLPVTGTAIGGIVIAGVALIGGGTALLLARRRRDASDAA